MLVGHARVSTLEQTLALQQDALTKAGCERTFTDTASGSRTDRPGLDEALGYVRPGGTLVVWRLDRLGRSLHHLMNTVGAVQRRGNRFKSSRSGSIRALQDGRICNHGSTSDRPANG